MGVSWPPKFDRLRQAALSRPSGALIIVCGCLAALLLWAQAPLGRLLPLSSPGALIARLQGPGHQRIPKILHQVYLSGREAFLNLSSDPHATMRPEWGRWCEAVHQGEWQYKFWTEQAAVELLERHYAWFLPTWHSYKEIVKKGDALRYFLMDHFGGVYYDLDVECFRPGEDLLAGADVVLQGTSEEEGVTNAVMASVPGHPLWTRVQRMMAERAAAGEAWVIAATGPQVVRDSVVELGIVNGSFPGDHQWQGTIVRVHPLGTWATPCWASNTSCHQRLALTRAAGLLSPQLCAYHRYTGSWLTWEADHDFLAAGGLDGRLLGTSEVQDAIVATIDERPPEIVRGRVDGNGMLRIACPRDTWRITAVSSASYRPSAEALAQAEERSLKRHGKTDRKDDGSDGQPGSDNDSGGGSRRLLAQFTCSSNSAAVQAAVAAACLGRSRCFLRPGEQALGPDPCAGSVPGGREMLATVTCTPPSLLNSSGLQPLTPKQRQVLKWRRSVRFNVSVPVEPPGTLAITCPASDWRVTKVAATCSRGRRAPPAAAAIQELCVGRAECQLDLPAELLPVGGKDISSSTAAVVEVTCAPRSPTGVSCLER